MGGLQINIGWRESTFRLHSFVANVSLVSSAMPFFRPTRVRLNRLRTGVGLFRSRMRKWGMAPSTACQSCTKEHTAVHDIITCQPHHSPPRWSFLQLLKRACYLGCRQMGSHLVDCLQNIFHKQRRTPYATINIWSNAAKQITF